MTAQPKILTTTLYIHAQKKFNGSYEYTAYTFKADPNIGIGFVVAEHTVELPFREPSKQELILAEVDYLRKEQDKILADAHIKTTQLEDHIQALLCLEGKPISKTDEQIPY